MYPRRAFACTFAHIRVSPARRAGGEVCLVGKVAAPAVTFHECAHPGLFVLRRVLFCKHAMQHAAQQLIPRLQVCALPDTLSVKEGELRQRARPIVLFQRFERALIRRREPHGKDRRPLFAQGVGMPFQEFQPGDFSDIHAAAQNDAIVCGKFRRLDAG